MDMEDTAETCWFSELGMEDPFVSDHYDITDFFDEELTAALGEEVVFQNSLPQHHCNSFSSKMISRNSSTASLTASSNPETPKNGTEKPLKHHNLNNYHNNNNNSASPEQASVLGSSSPMVLSFGNSNNAPEKTNPQNLIVGAMNLEVQDDTFVSRGSYTSLEEASKSVHPKKKTSSGRIRPPSQTYDHIIAERKRREQLSQQFVTLSSIIPGLKKMDKTSVLGDTIKYLKHLQDREKALEEQAKMQTMESMVLVKKSRLLIDDEDDDDDDDEKKKGSSDDHDQQAADVTCSNIEQPLPDIEVKQCDKHVLLRIVCEKQKGVFVKILSELEKLNLAITTTNVSSFGSLALHITITTEMRKDLEISKKEVIKVVGWAVGRQSRQI